MSWSPSIDWSTPAGNVLRALIAELPGDREFHITLFGSPPLQLAIESRFVSNGVDLFADETHAEVEAAIARAGIGEKCEDVYVQLCVEGNFRTSPKWKDRAFTIQLGNVRLTLPHPIDILIAKLHRLADKDLAAFRLVIERTGHPTEEDMKRELQFAVDLYRPNFDEEMIGDITTNTRVLWQELWKKDIDVRREIIAPALARRREGYAPDLAREDYKAELRRLGEE